MVGIEQDVRSFFFEIAVGGMKPLNEMGGNFVSLG